MDIKTNNLIVKKNTTDLSSKAYLFENDNISLTLLNTDYLYVSFKKPLKQVYIDLETANTTGGAISAQSSSDGLSWASIDVLDETQGLKRSGFIHLEPNSNTYYRFSLSISSSAMKIRGIGSQFCNESDLRLELPGVDRFYPRGFNSHINAIESATRYIVQKINNLGDMYKYDGTSCKMLNRYDFKNIDELKEPAKFYALHLICLSLSDSDDNYLKKSDIFLGKFNESFKVFHGALISIDSNDDGKDDDGETKSYTYKFIR